MVSTLVPDFVVLRDAMNQLFDESNGVGRGPRQGNGVGSMARALPLDVYATGDEIVVIAAVPGMDVQGLDITIDQNMLTLSGTIPSASESEQGRGATWFLHELWHGSFRRSVTLPFEVDAAKTEATFANGIVRIVMPKAAHARPQKIAIRTASSQESITAGGDTETP